MPTPNRDSRGERGIVVKCRCVCVSPPAGQRVQSQSQHQDSSSLDGSRSGHLSKILRKVGRLVVWGPAVRDDVTGEDAVRRSVG